MRPFTTYFDTTFNRSAVKIQAGEYHARRDDTMIVTVLGSCVSVCLRDETVGVGGMNHFMLPGKEGSCPRYGVGAMSQLIRQLEEMGGRRQRMVAKVFGAGKVIDCDTDVGRMNAEFALRYLEEQGIRVAAVDIGDVFPRKVYFSPKCGKVYVRRLRDSGCC